MERFETVIRVYNRADGPVEAAEKPGELFDTSRMENGMTLDCRLDGSDLFGPSVSERSGPAREYLTVFRILNNGEDALDAGERAGEIIDIFRADTSTAVSCSPTRCLSGSGLPAEDRSGGKNRGEKGSIREMPVLEPVF